MLLAQILQGIAHAQDVQDSEGDQHPGESFAFTFPVTSAQREYLARRRLPGLEFVETRDPRTQIIRVMGCFKPRKASGNASDHSVHA